VTSTQLGAFLKTALFAAVVPTSVAVLGPLVWLRPRAAELGPVEGWHWLGVVLVAGGATTVAWAMGLFAWRGLGTPAPFDPPKKFVALGPYRYVRNPMYVGVVLALLGEAVLFPAAARFLLAYTAAVWLFTHLFVVLYEEPTLRKKFGAEYEAYCARVRRWMPRIPNKEKAPAGADA
jgi:protein-S-isoprenylcysteine O-methyltransferase Ste14